LHCFASCYNQKQFFDSECIKKLTEAPGTIAGFKGCLRDRDAALQQAWTGNGSQGTDKMGKEGIISLQPISGYTIDGIDCGYMLSCQFCSYD